MEDVRIQLQNRTPKSREVYERSHRVLAQEVVGTVDMPYPFYIKEAKGSRVTDVDGNEYIDMTMGFGPHVLGHAPDVVVDAVTDAAKRGLQYGLLSPYQESLASLVVDASPCAEQVVFANSGTEATMYAVRAARAYSGKTKIAMFDGGYHGAHDYVLVNAHRDSPRTSPVPRAMGAGIPTGTTDQIIMLPYREEAAFDLIREHKDELALVMLEGVQSSNPRMDHGDFLKRLRDVCRDCGVLFLLDEVITGFRLAYGGAQDVFGVVPDLVTYGKAAGGGMPIGAIAGPEEIMKVFADKQEGEEDGPAGIFAGGTFSGNPMSMIAGRAAVGYMKDHPEVYRHLAKQGTRLTDEINSFCQSEELPAQMMSALSMFHLRFQQSPINSSRDIDESLKEAESEFYLHLLNQGVVVPGIHLAFISAAHTAEDIDQIIDAFKKSFKEVRQKGLV